MTRDPRDYKVELSSSASEQAETSDGAASRGNRPFLSIHFACCGVYSRIYRDDAANAYAGRCPRCGRHVSFGIGRGGTSQRSFVVE